MLRVLVVDDDRGIRELLRAALECEGYAVTTFCDGRGVVERLAGTVEPCVVLMDLSMPYVTGWDVCAALAASPAVLGNHQLVILTAEPLSPGACPAPARKLLSKPFDLDTICSLVASLYALPGMQSPSGIHAALPTVASPAH